MFRSLKATARGPTSEGGAACPLCDSTLDVNEAEGLTLCCARRICGRRACNARVGGGVACRLCGAAAPEDDAAALALLRRSAATSPAALRHLAQCHETGDLGLGRRRRSAAAASPDGRGATRSLAGHFLDRSFSAPEAAPGARGAAARRHASRAEAAAAARVAAAEAAELYRRAAAGGDAIAAFNLGLAYRNGDGVAADAALAARYWRQAADAGLPNARNNLGMAYAEGVGVQADRAAGVALLEAAAAAGLSDASYNLGVLCARAGETDAAMAWYERAAARGRGGRRDVALGGPGAGGPAPPSHRRSTIEAEAAAERNLTRLRWWSESARTCGLALVPTAPPP